MTNLEILKRDWQPLCANSPYEIPTNHPVVCMEHKQTRRRAYFDMKLGRFLSPQEAHMALNGYEWLTR